MLELEESEPNSPRLQEIDVESRLFLEPQPTRSVIKEEAAPAVTFCYIFLDYIIQFQ